MNLPVAFGKYLLIERIATGGMAEVFKAKSFGFGGFEKIVAIKRIHPHLSLDQEFVNMFIDEARIASNLSHPNIVQIFDLGKIDGSYFIAMEYVDGITLEKFIEMELQRKEKMLLSCYIVREICRALDYAHTKTAPDGSPLNIVHRDISPQNVLLSDDGVVKLTDFGVAKARLRISRTEPGMTKGKYPYMSPEQVMGKEIDHRSDIFSLSVLFYEMLTGRMAFDGKTEFEIMESIKKCEYVMPSKLNNLISEEIERLIVKGLQKNPEQRFSTAGAIALSLSDFLAKNNFKEPEHSLKRLVKQNRGEKVDTQDYKVNASTMILMSAKPKGIRRLFIPGIAGILALSSIIVYKSYYIKSKTFQEMKKSAENPHTEEPLKYTPETELRESSQKIEQSSGEQKADAVLNINTSPWSYVYIDGKKVGETPLFGVKLNPGEHNLIFENPQLNLRITKVIRVEAGEERTVLENLKE